MNEACIMHMAEFRITTTAAAADCASHALPTADVMASNARGLQLRELGQLGRMGRDKIMKTANKSKELCVISGFQ